MKQGALGFFHAILDGTLEPFSIWATLVWVAQQIYDEPLLTAPAELVLQLMRLPKEELDGARTVHHRVRVAISAFDTMLYQGPGFSTDDSLFRVHGDYWAKQDPANYFMWRQFGQTAIRLEDLMRYLVRNKAAAARIRVSRFVEREIQRIAELARVEAQRTGKSALAVAAQWVRSRTDNHFKAPHIKRLVAYPLAKRLQELGC